MKQVVQIQVKGLRDLANLETELLGINNELTKVKKELKDAFGAKDTQRIKTATGTYRALRQEQLRLQDASKKVRKEVNNEIQTWNNLKRKIPKDSLAGLRNEYNKLALAVSKLSKAEREYGRGKEMISKLKQTRAEISKIEQSYGQYGRNVGNYGSAFGGMARFGRSALGALGIAGLTYQAVQMGRDAVNVTRDYEQANATLAAIMGRTIEQTEELRQQQQQLGTTTAFTASEVTEMHTELAKLGFTQREIIDATPALINFSIAMRTSADRAAEAMGAVIRSFSLDASEMIRVTNVLGVAANRTALDFADLEAGLPIVSGVAAEFGATVEDVGAQLGVLSDRGITASTAATALRNIYLKANAAGLTYAEALKQVKESQDPVNEAFELFGVRGALQATILALNSEEVDTLTEELKNVGDEMQEVADKEMNTLTGKLTLLNSAWQGLILSIDSGQGPVSKFFKAIVEGATDSVLALQAFNEGTVGFWDYFLLKSKSTVAEMQREAIQSQQNQATIQSAIEEGIIDRYQLWIKSEEELIEIIKERRKEMSVENEANKQAEWLRTVQARIEALGKAADKTSKKVKKVVDPPDPGSMEWLQTQIKLYEELINKSTDDTVIDQYVESVMILQFQLEEAQKRIKALKDEFRAEYERQRMREHWNALGYSPERLGVSELPSTLGSKAMQKEDEKHMEKRLKYIQRWNNKVFEMYRDRLEKQRELEAKIQEEIQREVISGSIDLTSTLIETLYDIRQQQGERELDANLHRIEREYEARIDAAKGNKEAQESLERELTFQREKLKREEFEDNKKRQIAEALIQAALAIVQSLANTALPFPASLIGPGIITAKTAIQIGAIRSASYADGGFTPSTGVPDPQYPGRKVVGVVHDNEYVVRKEEIEAFPDEIRRIENHRVRGLKGFADGGFTTPIDYEYVSRMSTPPPAIDLERLYESIYMGSLQGAKTGSLEGTKNADKYRILRDIRERVSSNNIRQ